MPSRKVTRKVSKGETKRKPKSEKKIHPSRVNAVSVQIPDDAKETLDRICDVRGVSLKRTLARLIEWFVTLDRTEQSVVLGQLEAADLEVRERMMYSPEKRATM